MIACHDHTFFYCNKRVISYSLTIPFLETDNQCQFFILQQNDEWSSCHIHVDSQYLNALQYQGHRYHWCRGVQLQAVSHFGQRLLGHCTFGPEIFGTKIFGSETFGPKWARKIFLYIWKNCKARKIFEKYFLAQTSFSY